MPAVPVAPVAPVTDADRGPAPQETDYDSDLETRFLTNANNCLDTSVVLHADLAIHAADTKTVLVDVSVTHQVPRSCC